MVKKKNLENLSENQGNIPYQLTLVSQLTIKKIFKRQAITHISYFKKSDDGIERDITIEQEIFGEIYQYSTKFEVMRFTLSNKGKDSIRVQVLSLGATLASIKAPDR